MEAVKPKRKHRKKAKEAVSESPERNEVVEDLEGGVDNDRLTALQTSNVGESSGNAFSAKPKAEDISANRTELPSTSTEPLGTHENNFLWASSEFVGETTAADPSLNAKEAIMGAEKVSVGGKQDKFDSQNDLKENENGEGLENKEAITLNLPESAAVVINSVPRDEASSDNDVKASTREGSFTVESKLIDGSQTSSQRGISAQTDRTKEAESAAVKESHGASEREVAFEEVEGVNATLPLASDQEIKTSQMYPKLPSMASAAESSMREYETALEAFSEDHLKTLYFNPLLEQMEGFVEHFLRISIQDDHEFYELVNTYFRGRNALAIAFKEYQERFDGYEDLAIESSGLYNNQIVLAECEKKKEEVWITKDFSVTAQGKCLDQVTVTHNHAYQQVELNHTAPKEIENLLGKLQKALHETLALQKYTCQLARLHVDTYIYDMLRNSPTFARVSTDTLVTELCPLEISQDSQDEVHKLRDCISVLFMFVRQPIKDEEFVLILNGWMEQLVAVLLRVASLADLVFLLNHMLRCPPGFSSQIAHFLQFPVPKFKTQGYNIVDEPYYWDNPLVHHFVAMLAAVLLPIREREGFLHKLSLAEKGETLRSISWTIVDEDGVALEDEDPETTWMLIQENDLIAIFSQFPFDAIFKHLLKMDPNIPNDCLNESHYHVDLTSSRDIMRMLAFASCTVYMMGHAFRTYEKIRYRAFIKRVGRTIRQIVQYVLDHWSDYRSWRMKVRTDSADTAVSRDQYSLQRLQVEVDQFFLRAAHQIISAHRLGAWQFLADMPFRSVSSKTLWKLFLSLHLDASKLDSVETIQRENAYKDNWREILKSREGEFTDQLARISQSEAIFLLTTFANIATSREEEDKELIEAITLQVYKVSFISSQTRESCSKTGKHLLGTISNSHPFVISALLDGVSDTIETIGKACVYLFSGLSVHLWHPTYKNMDCIKSWLLKAGLSSPEHQLARYIISNLNWGQSGEPGESDRLFLHQCWHKALAVSLVEVSAVRLPYMPGGITHEAFKEDTGLLKQVTHMAAMSYNRMVHPNYEQQLYDWLWEVMLTLRLHPADLPTPVVQFAQRLPSGEELQGREEESSGFSSLVKALSKETLVLSFENALTSMTHAIKAGGQLACYAAIAMTSIGTSHDLFTASGLDYLTIIVNEKVYDAALRIVANVVPMFFSCPDKLVRESRFVSVIRCLSQLDNDNAGYAEKLLQATTVGKYCEKLVGIIQSHVQKFQVPGLAQRSLSVVEFWLMILCSLPNWYRDVTVQFLLDNLIKSALRVERGLSVIEKRLMDEYEILLKETGSQGVIASLLSLVTSNTNSAPVFWDIKATPDYSYYAYCVLCMETQIEDSWGLTTEMGKRLLKKPDATVDSVLKKVSKTLKLSWSPSLSIYRWSSQAMVTDMDHPMLPLIWQRFFSLYLQRPVTQPGLAERTGVGYRFFEGQYSSALKKMKERLKATSEHHRSKSAETAADHDAVTETNSDISKQFEQTKALHEKLAGFYQTLVLWLDEPRLHDPSLFLASLPPPYDAPRLETLLKVEMEPWSDLLFMNKIDMEITESVSCWMRHALGSQKKPVEGKATGPWTDRNVYTAASRIIRRMQTQPAPLPPPPVKRLEAVLPTITEATLMNKEKVTNIVYSQIQAIVNQARKFCCHVCRHIALDLEYVELLPKMYSNEMSQVVVQVPCRSKFYRDINQCRGPATLTIRFQAKRSNEIVIRNVAENRHGQEQVVQNFTQPCSSQLCEGAAYVESIITLLVNKSKASSERRTTEIITDIGTTLFYQFCGAMDDSVMSYQPTVQFFTSCVEMLGKTFIMNNPSQTEQLLSAILEYSSVSMLSVPFFSPNDNPDAFTTMYRRILESTNSDLVFALLTKFELPKWLSSQSSNLIERSSLTSAVFEALNSVGYEPAEDKKLILGVYLRHLSTMLVYNFPEQYSDSLRLLCEGSSKRSLCLDVWDRFLSCIGCVPNSENQQQSSSQEVLGDEQVLETLVWLTRYFSGQRAELGGHVTGGLYTMWRPYIKQLSFVLGFMCQRIVVRRAAMVLANSGQGLDAVLTELWSLICGVFEPWICAQDSPIPGNDPVAPWNESEVSQASDMVTLFTDTLGCLQTHLNAPYSSTSMMNMFWSFFATSLAKPGVPDFVLRVYNAKFYSLPWQSFLPTLLNMELMVQNLMLSISGHNDLASQFLQMSYTVCKNSFRFLGLVFPLMDWSKISSIYCESQTAEAVSRLHSSLFHLLVIFANEQSVAIQGMKALLDSALAFPWHYLDGRSFEEVVSWQISHGKAELVIDEKSSIWYALRLIRAAAGIVIGENGSMQPTRPDTAVKRSSYVRCVTTLLSECSKDTRLKPQSFGPAILFVLVDVQSVAGSGVDPASTASEVCMMISEQLNLLNNCSPVGDVPKVILDFILQFIRDTSCTMLVLASIPAACRTLASIQFMVSVLETGIESFFAKHSSQYLVHSQAHPDGGWEVIVPSVAVPELAQDEFVQECVRQGAILTLYTNILLKLSSCESPVQEMNIVNDIVSWCTRIKLRRESETKMTLLWHKILHLAVRQVYYATGSLRDLVKQLCFLAASLHSLGEDKASSGLLGAIGFGKKSQLSVKLSAISKTAGKKISFRFMCRALEAFLLAQMPSNAPLRLEAKAPGYVREPRKTKQMAPGRRVVSSTPEAEQALTNLEILRSNKQYTGLAEQIVQAHSFIANPLHSLIEGPELVTILAQQLFPNEKALVIMLTSKKPL